MQLTLTKNKTTLIDDADFELVGKFKWTLLTGKGRWIYAHRMVRVGINKRKGVLLHRFLMGAKPGQYVDHINGDSLDNRRANLRICTNQQNCFNRIKLKKASSVFKGVHKSFNKWKAQIQINGKRTCLGSFDTEKEAALKFNEFAKIHYGSFTKLNEVNL